MLKGAVGMLDQAPEDGWTAVLTLANSCATKVSLALILLDFVWAIAILIELWLVLIVGQ